jgi:putative ABC transport system permease protein
MIRFNQSIGGHYQAFKEQVRQVAGVSGVSTSVYPMYEGYSSIPMKSHTMQKAERMILLNVDEQFIPLLHIRWLFPPRTQSNYIQDQQIIINEAAISQFNLPANPLGETLRLENKEMRIAGVVKNFNYAPLRSKIEALSLFIEKDSSIGWGSETKGCLFAKIGPHVNIPTVVESFQKIYSKYDQKTPFSFEFMDDVFNAGYKAEERLGDLFGLFTGLMILIACLGLFGLVAFSATQRTREIGIRKVLGASIQSIMGLMAKDFLLYIGISILVAIPITWYAMSQWLQNFAYKIPLSWELFGLAGVITLTLALVTIGGIAFKAAKANPVKNLRAD